MDSWNDRAISFAIPITGVATETFPEGGATDATNGYISAPPTGEGCTQEFRVVAINPATGD